ncbi:OCIA domain-containing protein 1-like [Eriocheir sinensis]|uniref:OCIA domain-containing protein 1-like n=1 Tax=Eriocheir sinensis TaxID=95602 RepID=UPI0021C675FE|nr:OCIA domain-containing protein 1-like [Eriocheir sinensis]
MASQGMPGRQGGGEGQFRPAFNQEELRVLRECNRESFYFRSLPFAAAMSGAAFLAMRRGMLRTSDRFGYTPKMVVGAAIGYFIGKLSYQGACAEKLMRLPDSPIGDALRKRKNRAFGTAGVGGGGFEERVSSEAGFSVGQPSQSYGEVRSTEGLVHDPRHELDLTEGLDDYHRVTESLSPYTDDSSSSSSSSLPPSTSYQELRRQNREEYVNKMAEKYRRPGQDTQPDHPSPSPLPPPPPSSFPSSSSSFPSSSSSSVRKNQYGDDVYE